ncbi:unnamed protein product [Arctia plantaginis]|uniref:Defensin n=1 Tax=Arctia plantaginis TaxID=874455 RepID=A0A8S1BEM9_ARCPL|nr:unnamed protein product [Arctia plantaginis]CAB3256777.1 unnamed protein product [Arctia plantaginis]
MRACIVFAVFLVAFAAITSEAHIRDEESTHLLEKRDTIHVQWPVSCVFYECNASCRRRGHSGGTCSVLTGCSCVG